MPGEKLLEKRSPYAAATKCRNDEHALEPRNGTARLGTNAGQQEAHGAFLGVPSDESEAVAADTSREVCPAGRRSGEERVSDCVVATRTLGETEGTV